MTRHLISKLLLSSLLLTGPCLAASSLTDENLLTTLPPGFKVGFSVEKGRMTVAEYVPEAETVQDWSTMITVQTFHGMRSQNPDAFGTDMKKKWGADCPGGEGRKIRAGAENGYPIGVWMFLCPLNPETEKPENMWLKAIGGRDSFYVVQYAVRKPMSNDLIKPAISYLKRVAVCDTRLPDRACPKGM